MAAAALGSAFCFSVSAAKSAVTFAASLKNELAAIERRSGGRLGIAILDTGSQARAGHRAAERSPLCSTFKFLAAAAVLKRVDDGREQLDRRVHFQAADLITHSPVTKDHAGDTGMTVAELCAAAMIFSDNTAANLILQSLGGPEAVTAFARSIGDPTTRLDRTEPTLNEATPGDPRDTTTPAAMLRNLQTLVLGDGLSAVSRERLKTWLLGNRTGDKRLRAGLPAGWQCGDKTGSGGHGTANDIGIFWPPQRPPVIVVAYLTETSASDDQRDAALADVARATAAAFTG
jgi:beta-lactamase class A